MVNYSTLAIPIIALLAIGGVISFLIVYSVYPEKHENINIEGKCYELVGMAHQKFTNLTSEMQIKKLILQVSKVEPDNASIPIIFNGKDSEIEGFMNRYHLTVTSNQKVIYFPNINGSVVTANVPKADLQRIVDSLSIFDVFPSAKSVEGSIGIQPNNYITPNEHRDVSFILDKSMKNGLTEIIAKSDGVKSAECRNDT